MATALAAVIAASCGKETPFSSFPCGDPADYDNPRDATLACAAQAAVAVARGAESTARQAYARHLARWPVAGQVRRTAPAPVPGPRLRLERSTARALGRRRPRSLAPRGAGDRTRPGSGTGGRPDRRRGAGPGARPLLPAAAVVGRAGRSSCRRGSPPRAQARPLASRHARADGPPAVPRDGTVGPAAARSGSDAAPRGTTRAPRVPDPDRCHRTDAADAGRYAGRRAAAAACTRAPTAQCAFPTPRPDPRSGDRAAVAGTGPGEGGQEPACDADPPSPAARTRSIRR